MNVLTTSMCYPTPSDSDQGVFVQHRARALAELPGHRVRVVAPQLHCPILRPSRDYDNLDNPLPTTYPRMFSLPILSRLLDGISYSRALQRAIASWGGAYQLGIDLIDAHFVYPDGVGAWLTGRQMGLPVCVTVRGKIVSLSRKALRRLQIRTMLRSVQARIAVSQSLADWVHRVAGSDLEVDVIPNGVNTQAFHLIQREEAREALGWEPGVPYVLAVGHLQKLKGYDRLVDIWSELRDNVGDARLILVGSARGERAYAKQLNRMVRDVNQKAGRIAIDYVGTAPPGVLNIMYNAADLSAVASRSEGWCNAISESLAVGTPVVATDVGGNPEQISSTELGLLVPNGKRDALRSALEEGLTRHWNRVLISAHGSARTWRHVSCEVVDVLQRTLQRHIASVDPTGQRMTHAQDRLAADVAASSLREVTS